MKVGDARVRTRAMRRTSVMVASGSLAVLLSTAAGGTARADEWSLHVLGNAISAWSDNIYNQPDADAQSDFYYQLRPGALFHWTKTISFDIETACTDSRG